MDFSKLCWGERCGTPWTVCLSTTGLTERHIQPQTLTFIPTAKLGTPLALTCRLTERPHPSSSFKSGTFFLGGDGANHCDTHRKKGGNTKKNNKALLVLKHHLSVNCCLSSATQLSQWSNFINRAPLIITENQIFFHVLLKNHTPVPENTSDCKKAAKEMGINRKIHFKLLGFITQYISICVHGKPCSMCYIAMQYDTGQLSRMRHLR